MQYNYNKKMFIRRAKPIGIIGDLDNQRLDEWSAAIGDMDNQRPDEWSATIGDLDNQRPDEWSATISLKFKIYYLTTFVLTNFNLQLKQKRSLPIEHGNCNNYRNLYKCQF